MTSLMDHDINVLYLWTSSELLPGEPIKDHLLLYVLTWKRLQTQYFVGL